MKTRNKLLATALTLAVPICTWAQTEVEPNNNTGQATAVAYNTAMAGSTGACSPTDNSIDYFTFTPPSQGALRLQFSASNSGGSDLDITVDLRNNINQTLGTFTVHAGANNVALDTTINFNCTGTDVYYLVFNNPSGSVCTNYSFTYDILDPFYGNDVENNDNTSQATDTIAPGTNMDGHVNFYYDDASDYYRILAPNDGMMTVQVVAEHAGNTPGTVTVYLRNDVNQVLETWTANVGANGIPDTTTFTHYCTGHLNRYYLVMQNPDVCGVSYRMNYAVMPAFYTNDTEPNQNTSQAADTIAPGANMDGHVDFYYDDAIDYYRILAPNDGVMTVQVTAEHAGNTPGNVTVYLKNDINQTLETWTANVGANGIPDTTTFSHYCTGHLNRYYLVMQSPDVCGVSYRMNYTVTPAFYTNDTEPNQNTSQATDTIPPGTNMDGHVAFYYDDATDYYRILAPNDGVMTVQVMAEHAGNTPGNVMVYLKNDINQVLESWTANVGANGIPDTTTFTHYCTGHLNRYYLVMEGPDVCGVSYRMSYTVAPAAFANDVEENDNTSQAADTIPPGTNMDGHVAFNYDDATDYYRILAPTDGVLNVNFQAEHAAAGPGTVTVYLRNNINQTIVTWFANVGANGMAEDTTFTHNCTGHQAIYYLLVQNPDVCGVSYRMSYSVTPAVYADDAEPNQNTGQAIPIDLNNAGATGHVGFEYDNNEDFYVINHPGGDINVYTLAENAGAAGAMTVYIRNNINQTLVTGTADVGGNSIPSADTISLAGAAAGTYHIVVSNPDVCGVSYMLRCYDDDNDGVCNGSDLCPGTPNGEGVNGDGCACSQLTVDDGDPCTLDECSNGIVTHTFQDADGDLTCDAQDGCPNDPNKIAAGACGCGNPDVPTTWYADTDGDGFGDPNDSQAGFTCNQPPGYVADNTDLCPTDINKQDPGACGCGVADVATTWYADTDGDGLGDPNNSQAGFTCNQPVGYVADNTDLCPAVAGTVGSTCDDGNPNTTGDVLDGSCNCVGFLVDCEGTPGGPALPGTACDDGNANTGNDTWDANCNCVGEVIDCLGVPGGPALPGTACDDGDANTGNDTWDGNCTCVGQLIDCLGVPGGPALPGTSCDDGNANTDNDAWDGNCTCVGTPSGGPCTGDQVMVYITTDADPGQLSWEITNDGGTVIAAGSPAAANTLVGEPACLNASPASAWYGFRLMDSNGDGISGGGWELRTTDGKLIMGDAFSDGASSPANPPLSGSYGSHHRFALPLAAPDVHPAECGVFDNRSDNKVFANKVAGTNYQGGTLNYQFEFSDPDSGYVRRIKKPRNYVVFSELNPGPLKGGKHYFTRVRTDKAGPVADAHWGAGCEMGLGTTVNCTQLIESPTYGHSCNETRRYGPSSFIYAQPVFGASQYEFRIFNTGEGYDETYVRNTYILELFGFANPLLDGYSYQVQVRAKVSDTWGSYCGTCAITIDNQQQMNEHLVQAAGEVTLWPNPARDGQVYLNIDGIEAATQQITVDVKDIYGQQVYGQAFGNSGERFSTVLNLPADIASGVYLVNITVNGEVTTHRLSIVR